MVEVRGIAQQRIFLPCRMCIEMETCKSFPPNCCRTLPRGVDGNGRKPHVGRRTSVHPLPQPKKPNGDRQGHVSFTQCQPFTHRLRCSSPACCSWVIRPGPMSQHVEHLFYGFGVLLGCTLRTKDFLSIRLVRCTTALHHGPALSPYAPSPTCPVPCTGHGSVEANHGRSNYIGGFPGQR